MTVRDAASPLGESGAGEKVTSGAETVASVASVAAGRPVSAPRREADRETDRSSVRDVGDGASEPAGKGGDPADIQALIQRARAGERAAFRQLVDRHQRRVYQLALSIVRSHEDAMDVVQETFIRVHQNLPNYKGDAAFYTWVYRIARNAAIDQQRRQRRADFVEIDENTLGDESADTDLRPAESTSPLKAALRGELADVLATALSSLSEAHRSILVLREVDGLSYEELAQTLGIPKGTVMSRLFHARHRMQVLLADYLDGDDEAGESAVGERHDKRNGTGGQS